ncbi:MAG: PLP-dependent aminotransferase family protein [Hoeflea sp.]|uniref:MocR-like pyridoxine biosynthesis transcription factor PdxR n=1 Tax=Hoeflea sp. TaxID=1940281 RepID=UPI001DE53E52|nr:PLP-dependent aminotransferase family protein [Hoeflea sp.]MBU4528105.1 PLP-dependent aminotransferase family protein [Alphaproteobacteria bacterium]MBU4543701.1 PLP-dependent aminotransferase family protein [Alphaproteobacteria bacterium]MBU4548568.1 PLP-dependent aminotransferase family protein [Alphaproteobacteria bacterium]MBV1725734.1 PLP-dependent aminotransferase family protein [Hoeflea sp.]MBV1762090.1 PLP-dependent aminotransferase family protein [Hoeflea sp.]
MKTKAGAILSSIRIDRSQDRKISVQLYMGLRDIILSGGLSGGERLPATRTLASEVGVSRTTALDAVSRLISEGLLESRIGAGTFVSHTMTGRVRIKPEPAKAGAQKQPRLSQSTLKAYKLFAERRRLPNKSQAFVTALPALNTFPMAQWARLSARHLRTDRDAVMGYGNPFGLQRLRAAISAHLNASRGIQCDPEQVFIVGGAQQAFSLIGGMLLDQGEKVWFENPGAIGARNAFVSQGADLVPVAVDDEGIVVDDGLAKAPDFRLAFVTPSHQQPLSKVLSLSRRLALLDAADRADAFIVEDDYDGDFYFGDQPLPTLKSIDTHGRVIYVGTFSKTLFPSLRLGFLVAPASMVEAMMTVFSSALSGVPTWPQAVVADFIDEGHFATHIRTMRQHYKRRHEVLHHNARQLEPHLLVQRASAGFHTVGYFSDPQRDEGEFIKAAGAAGLTLSGIGRYCLAPIEKKGVVIGYGAASESEIKQGMEVMAQLLA